LDSGLPQLDKPGITLQLPSVDDIALQGGDLV
jgi:hypothetical protein